MINKTRFLTDKLVFYSIELFGLYPVSAVNNTVNQTGKYTDYQPCLVESQLYYATLLWTFSVKFSATCQLPSVLEISSSFISFQGNQFELWYTDLNLVSRSPVLISFSWLASDLFGNK